MKQPIRHVEAPEETPEKTLGRRELLKALAAAGGAVTASSLLPGEWAKPVVEVGVLPAHAQVSDGQGPGPGPLLSITTCSTANINGGPIGPSSTLVTYAIISPAEGNIQLRRTMTRNDVNPSVVIDVTTGYTNGSGRWDAPNFTLPGIGVGNGNLTVLWEFVNPDDGTNTCQNNVDIVG
jgi:hypothetical protein